ncbi:TonB-dependent receptor plug domain-containing protein [Flavobacterium sp. LC2016-23]|uniref:TonB-dependent receptor n=1 Tax=Flavobacterium sp. LC2016-23 TaxID=2666330 RepID=UPI0012AFC3E2|nr:TonB-dependent receptor [Flavobacterium sp. LC2016-23]MRX39464.1 TonB-dependent receptor plug domain-containing protein [Flavobacterium sp. LC2016-23]
MKTMKNWLLTGLLFMVVSTVFSQGKVTGTITDASGATLPGANVAVKGSQTGTSTDFDGKFTIDPKTSTGELVITYLGYDSKTLQFSVSNGGTTNLGEIVLSANSNELSEIVVKSTTVDIAKDRKTPVAVSTIRAAEIQEKLGNLELPEILKSTPSVYVSKSGGGYGDSRITIRGFSQNNIAVMVNGMPVNDMENGSVYWSNWSGLSDVTSAIQVQRGLGSSKLAIASVGGTMNYVTKASDLKQGGTVGTSVGNDNFFKTNVAYNTGKLDSGFSASVLYSHTQGDGYVDATKFNGDNYYIGLGYATKDNKHDFQFTVTGAPQWHDQRSTFITIAQYQQYGSVNDPNIKYNADWGYKNGQSFNMVRNYYHKPVVSLNWDYKINETSKLSTVAYVSFGRGGGSRGAGGIRGFNYTNNAFRTADGLIDYDKIVAYNSGQTVSINGTSYTRTTNGASGQFQNSSATGSLTNSTSGISQISSVNSHNWYGAIVNFNKKFTDHLTWDLGIDVRGYKGIHYQNLNNLLGANSYTDNFDVNNPNRVLSETYSTYPAWNVFKSTDDEKKINFYNDGDVRWYGGFTQLEYSNDNLTVFVQGALSQQGFKRVDYFKYLSSNELSSTSFENILGGNVKGGANYNINENHNVYFNTGYYSKQPFFNAVYPNNASLVNGNLTNEKIFGLEAGYGFRSRIFTANVNIYRTSWKDRYQRQNDNDTSNPGGYYDFSGITEIHSGIEFDGRAKVTDKLNITGMFSLGDWKYDGTSTSNRYDSANNPIGGGTTTILFLDGVKVGDAAQLTAALGANYEILPRFTVDANYNYTDKLYAAISPGNFTKEDNKGSLELPSFGLVDAGLSYKWLVGKTKSNSVGFRLNVNNVFDTVYIAEAKTNYFAADYPTQPTYKGIATNNQVFFGFGRTWNFSLRYDF